MILFAVDFLFDYGRGLKEGDSIKKLNTGLAPKRWKIPQGSLLGFFVGAGGWLGAKSISTPTLFPNIRLVAFSMLFVNTLIL